MVDTSPAHLNNVQGDILYVAATFCILSELMFVSVSLPKFCESFIFFQINGDQIQKFRQQLSNLIPLITTAAEGKRNLQKVVEHKKWYSSNGSQKHMGNERLTITGINIAFSHGGLAKVCRALTWE